MEGKMEGWKGRVEGKVEGWKEKKDDISNPETKELYRDTTSTSLPYHVSFIISRTGRSD